MDIYQAPVAWVMPADYRHLEQLIEGLESLSRRGEDWDYERDDKGLVKFGFASQTVANHFRSMLRRCEASAHPRYSTLNAIKAHLSQDQRPPGRFFIIRGAWNCA